MQLTYIQYTRTHIASIIGFLCSLLSILYIMIQVVFLTHCRCFAVCHLISMVLVTLQGQSWSTQRHRSYFLQSSHQFTLEIKTIPSCHFFPVFPQSLSSHRYHVCSITVGNDKRNMIHYWPCCLATQLALLTSAKQEHRQSDQGNNFIKSA